MRVLQINAVYGHSSTGVIVKDIYNLCESENIDCFVASPDPNVISCKNGYRIGNKLDHKLHALLSRIAGKQAYYSTIPTRNLCKYIERIAPDIVHLHNLHSNYIQMNTLLKFLAKKKIPVVITLHDCWFYTGGCFHYTDTECYKWQENCGQCPRKYSDNPAYLKDSSSIILNDRKASYKRLNNLVVTGVSNWISSQAKKSILADYKILTIGNGVDTKLFYPCSSTVKQNLGIEDKFVILGPASKWLMLRNKEFLLDFSSRMKSDEILLLYGANQVPTDLPSNVRTYGFIHDKDELAALYSGADVFANVSHEDSFSLINIESQACGTPVVTFACTGLTDTVDNRCGFSVQEDDVDEMYGKIQYLRSNDLASFSHKCRQYIINTHDKDIVYRSYINLYSELYNIEMK